jgi:hypothetical protein
LGVCGDGESDATKIWVVIEECAQGAAGWDTESEDADEGDWASVSGDESGCRHVD